MIDVKKLYFSYTDKPFVENVSFHVGRGEIFGFLGRGARHRVAGRAHLAALASAGGRSCHRGTL